MQPPVFTNSIFAVDGLDISMYNGIEQMRSHIELFDLLSSDIQFYAGDGSRIRVHGSLPTGAEFERTSPTPESADALRTSLLGHLIAVGKLNADSDQTLTDVVRIFQSHYGTTDSTRKNHVAPKAILLMTIALLAITIIILLL